ncbi:hypothetical protein M3Y95_00400300 [Aphelenchoides besseyi]|nr:hypothetical protein M3Y95_00400300 [Aphelenchoides besseyi]
MSENENSTSYLWVTGLPMGDAWIGSFLWAACILIAIYIAAQLYAFIDLHQHGRRARGLIQAPVYEEREWAEETKYYTVDADEKDVAAEKERKAHLTSKVELKTKGGTTTELLEYNGQKTVLVKNK